MTRFRPLFFVLAVALFGALSGFTGCTTDPTAAQVTQIEMACNADAALRPTVKALLPLTTASEALAITQAELVIDQVCSNPASAPATNALASFNQASGQIVALVITLKERKAATVTPAASAPSAP